MHHSTPQQTPPPASDPCPPKPTTLWGAKQPTAASHHSCASAGPSSAVYWDASQPLAHHTPNTTKPPYQPQPVYWDARQPIAHHTPNTTKLSLSPQPGLTHGEATVTPAPHTPAKRACSAHSPQPTNQSPLCHENLCISSTDANCTKKDGLRIVPPVCTTPPGCGPSLVPRPALAPTYCSRQCREA